ncbi:hypothetical protein B296_00036316 [Ensete ventricosum]|uniref:Uncharacterized protein n=1 Tax=Ensete ventricosum TaxID=4639 RepID=A0A427A2Z4_ENSVE|nr:hypothetical protein B296_00036316 [Ensete ventricosum]
MVELTELAGEASKTDDGLVEIRVANPYMRVLPPEPYHFLVEQSVVILEEIVSFLQASGVVLEVPLAGAVQQGEDAREAPARAMEEEVVVSRGALHAKSRRYGASYLGGIVDCFDDRGHVRGHLLQGEASCCRGKESTARTTQAGRSVTSSSQASLRVLSVRRRTRRVPWHQRQRSLLLWRSSGFATGTAEAAEVRKPRLHQNRVQYSLYCGQKEREEEGGGTKEIDDQAAVGAAARRVAEEGHAVRSIADIWSGEGIGVSNKKIAGVGERVSEVEYGIESTGGGGEMEARDQKEQNADGRLHGKHLKDLNEALRPPSGTLLLPCSLLHQIYS